ncbi:MAG: glycosyl transferase family 2 [Mucilaginibacter sp.]|nr:glycosyl transferase family 2 [Mucilaginibacter sp.]
MKCLSALLRQKFDKRLYEIIVVSDGPDCETAKVMELKSKSRAVSIRYLVLPQKKGPAAARNYGWLNARGNVIAFTDDDCLPDKNWLSKIYQNIDPGAFEAITGRVIVPRSKRPTDYERNTMRLEAAEFITANCACTKQTLIKTGGFDEQFSMAWREDSDLEFKLIQEDIPIWHLGGAIVTHPVRRAEWGVSIKEQKKTQFNALLYKKYPELYREKIQPNPPLLYYAIIMGFMLMLTGILIDVRSLGFAGFLVWLLLTIQFIAKRLHNTQLSARHIAEMVVTSFIIPFVSIYWQWYGAIKYKVFFI